VAQYALFARLSRNNSGQPDGHRSTQIGDVLNRALPRREPVHRTVMGSAATWNRSPAPGLCVHLCPSVVRSAVDTVKAFPLPPPRTASDGWAECKAEEDHAAEIDAEDVADFVSAPGVVGGENRNIFARQQARQRGGHKRPVHRALPESSSRAGPVQPGLPQA